MGEYKEPIKWGLIRTSLNSGFSQEELVDIYDNREVAQVEADRSNADTIYDPEAGIGEYYDVTEVNIGRTAVTTVITTEYTTRSQQDFIVTRHVKENI